MEPMVIFSVGLVVYCGYLACLDSFRDRERSGVRKTEAVGQKKLCPAPERVIFSSRGREDGAGTHFPGLVKGSV